MRKRLLLVADTGEGDLHPLKIKMHTSKNLTFAMKLCLKCVLSFGWVHVKHPIKCFTSTDSHLFFFISCMICGNLWLRWSWSLLWANMAPSKIQHEIWKWTNPSKEEMLYFFLGELNHCLYFKVPAIIWGRCPRLPEVQELSLLGVITYIPPMEGEKSSGPSYLWRRYVSCLRGTLW